MIKIKDIRKAQEAQKMKKRFEELLQEGLKPSKALKMLTNEFLFTDVTIRNRINYKKMIQEFKQRKLEAIINKPKKRLPKQLF